MRPNLERLEVQLAGVVVIQEVDDRQGDQVADDHILFLGHPPQLVEARSEEVKRARAVRPAGLGPPALARLELGEHLGIRPRPNAGGWPKVLPFPSSAA